MVGSSRREAQPGLLGGVCGDGWRKRGLRLQLCDAMRCGYAFMQVFAVALSGFLPVCDFFLFYPFSFSLAPWFTRFRRCSCVWYRTYVTAEGKSVCGFEAAS
ncbi:hypothetical protein LZ32DRAFT_601745 [Colletotrichum eremochloae]|nr:hypothetical protein LZ32DRAFT_601745 [Colletotrichum eremochloae]